MAHNVTQLGTVLYDATSWRDLLRQGQEAPTKSNEDLLAALFEDDDEETAAAGGVGGAGGFGLRAAGVSPPAAQGSPSPSAVRRQASGGSSGGGAPAGASQHHRQEEEATTATATTAAAGKGGGRKRNRKQQQGISAAQVNALEKEYLQKLELFKRLTAAQQTLKDKTWVLDQVLSAHEDLAHRLQLLQAWEAGQQQQAGSSGSAPCPPLPASAPSVLPPQAGVFTEQPPPGPIPLPPDFRDPFLRLGLSIQGVRSASPQGALDMLKQTQRVMAKELLRYEMSAPDEAQRLVHPELRELAEAMLEANKFVGLVRTDLVMYNSLHVDSVLTGEGSFASSADAMPQPPPSHWRSVAVAANLPAQSLARCHTLSCLAEGWLERIQAERRVLSAALAQLVATAGAQRYLNSQALVGAASSGPDQLGALGAGLPGAGGPAGAAMGSEMAQHRQLMAQVQALASNGSSRSGDAAMALLLGQPGADAGGVAGLPQDLPPEDSIVARMQANVDKERNVILLVAELLWTRIYTAVEAVRVYVHSHPWIPDDLVLMRELSRLHLEGQAAQAGAAGKAAT